MAVEMENGDKADHDGSDQYPEERAALVRMCQQLQALGLGQSISDSASCRVTGGCLVTALRVPYCELEPGDIVFVAEGGCIEEGSAPCSEWRLHAQLYTQHSGAQAAVHSHTTYAAALAAQRRAIPAFHYMVAPVAEGKTIECSTYALSGTGALCNSVLEALGDRKAALIANHGMFCYGPSLAKTIWRANEAECLAKQYATALSTRVEPTLLSDEEMDVMLAKFKTYGKQAVHLKELTDFERRHAVKSPPKGGSEDRGAPYPDLRKQVISTCLRMNSLGINQGTSGNVSCRVPGGFLISASGVSYDDMKPEHVVFMDTEGRYYGKYLPSSEWRMHYDTYKCMADAQAVVHAHPVYSTALACLPRAVPPFHYMVAAAGGDEIACADYASFGTQELSDKMIEAMGPRRCALLANHGLTCYGSNLENALWLTNEAENLARQYVATLATGIEPVLLSSAEMSEMAPRFKAENPLKLVGKARKSIHEAENGKKQRCA